MTSTIFCKSVFAQFVLLLNDEGSLISKTSSYYFFFCMVIKSKNEMDEKVMSGTCSYKFGV